MKKSELKKILKPLIKECVKEVILDEGILSNIISEVARGVVGAPLVETQAQPDPVVARFQRNAFNNKQNDKLKEQKRKLMEAVGSQAYNGVNLFEGTSPGPAQTTATQQANPMAGDEPGDSGVDINSLFGSVGKNWNAHMEKVKE
jgi:hypothetical protein